MKVFVETNNTRGRFRLTPADVAKAEAVGFSVLSRYGDDDDTPMYRDESDHYAREHDNIELMRDPRFQGRFVIDIAVDDEQKAWATARWKFNNAVGEPADCDCCGPSHRFTTDDVWSY